MQEYLYNLTKVDHGIYCGLNQRIHRTRVRGNFLVTNRPSGNIRTILSSKSILKVLAATVGHVNSLGNTM